MAKQARRPYTRRIQPHPCVQCGEITQRPKYCGTHCIDEARRRRKGVRPIEQQRAEEHDLTHRECPECNRVFRITRHDNHSKGPQIHCSNHCRRAKQRRARELMEFIQAEKNLYQRWSWAAKKRQRIEAKRRICTDCGGEVGKRYIRCASCQSQRAAALRCGYRQTPEHRASRLRAKTKRRMRCKRTPCQQFDPIAVLTRDKWRCYICGCDTPKHLRGSYENNAPEVDHVIPLAKGGEHSMANCRCACRKCNGQKSDRLEMQEISISCAGRGRQAG